MSKSVLVIGAPENRYSCYLRKLIRVKPDWCPLIDLPEKDNGDYPSNTSDMLALWKAGTSVLMRLQEEILMINLTGKKRVCKDTGRIF